MKKEYKKVLTIAGSDSGGGAGIQADIKAISALGCYAASVITALTAQNTVTVKSIYEVDPQFIGEQIDAVLQDIGADAVKIGMLQKPEIISIVSEKLKSYSVKNIVLDPVMVAKSGDKLLMDEAIDALKTELIPIASIITPNLPEAEVLLGREITKPEDTSKAAEDLLELGPGSVLIKGGHFSGKMSDDCLIYKNEDGKLKKRYYQSARIDSVNTHGTGCTLSSSIASFLALGYQIEEAVGRAKEYITKAIFAAKDYKIGEGHGPVHHFHNFWE